MRWIITLVLMVFMASSARSEDRSPFFKCKMDKWTEDGLTMEEANLVCEHLMDSFGDCILFHVDSGVEDEIGFCQRWERNHLLKKAAVEGAGKSLEVRECAVRMIGFHYGPGALEICEELYGGVDFCDLEDHQEIIRRAENAIQAAVLDAATLEDSFEALEATNRGLALTDEFDWRRRTMKNRYANCL